MRLVFDHGVLREFHAKSPTRAAASVKDVVVVEADYPEYLVAALLRGRNRLSMTDGKVLLDGKPLEIPAPAPALSYAEARALVEEARTLAALRPLLRLLCDELLRQGAIEL